MEIAVVLGTFQRENVMRKDAIESCLFLLQTTIKRLEQTNEWPEAKSELLDLLQALENELSDELGARKGNEKINRIISRAMYLIGILLGLVD